MLIDRSADAIFGKRRRKHILGAQLCLILRYAASRIDCTYLDNKIEKRLQLIACHPAILFDTS